MEDSKSEPWERRPRVKCYTDDPFKGIPDPPARSSTSIWAQYPMTTPGQWGAAAEAAYIGGQWISPDWTSLQVTEYWIGFYEHRKAILLPEAYWKKEGGK